MSFINISSEEDSYTSISNNFIEYYMADANGDFVKLYLYLAMLSSERRDISLSDIADHMNCSENDVCRGIRYWIRADVLRLMYSDAEQREVSGIILQKLRRPNDTHSSDLKLVDFRNALTGVDRDSLIEAEAAEDEAYTAARKAPRKKQPTKQELDSKLKDTEIQNLINEATIYCKRELSQKELDSIIYIKDQLGFSFDLTEYLLEYCAEIEKTSFNYIEKVARNWYEEGITTRDAARDYSQRFLTLYGRILKAMGIRNRFTPAPVEKRYIDKWLSEYGFSEPIILEACNRAIERKPNDVSFPYVNGILDKWYKNGVKTFKDISAMDDSRTAAAKKAPRQKKEQKNAKLRELEQYYLTDAYSE